MKQCENWFCLRHQNEQLFVTLACFFSRGFTGVDDTAAGAQWGESVPFHCSQFSAVEEIRAETSPKGVSIGLLQLDTP